MTTFHQLIQNGMLEGVGQVTVGGSELCQSWYETEEFIFLGKDDLDGIEKTVMRFVSCPEFAPNIEFKIPYDSPVEFDGFDIHVKDISGKELCLSFQKIVDVDPESFVNKTPTTD